MPGSFQDPFPHVDCAKSVHKPRDPPLGSLENPRRIIDLYSPVTKKAPVRPLADGKNRLVWELPSATYERVGFPGRGRGKTGREANMTKRSQQTRDSSSTGWKMKDVLWDDRSGTGFALTGPRTLLLTFSGQCGYNRLVEVCYYIGRFWKAAVDALVIDFDALKWVDKEGIRHMMAQLDEVTDRTGGRVYIVHAPPDVKRTVYRLGNASPIRLGGSLEEVLKRVAHESIDPTQQLYKEGPPDPDKKGGAGDSQDEFRPSRRIQLRELNRRADSAPQRGGPNLLDVLP